MTIVTPAKFDCFTEDVMHKVHDFSSDTFKLALTNSAPAASNSALTDIVEISTLGGYTAGGITIPVTSSGQTLGAYKCVFTDTTITAVTDPIDAWRWAVLYNDTSSGDKLIYYWDYGSAIVIGAGESFLFDFNDSLGAITL